MTEDPHPTGAVVNGSLRGVRFELVLEAREMTCTEWNSSEYYSNTVRSYWYTGEAKVIQIGRKKPLACFLTSFSRPPKGGQLQDAILRISDRHLAHKRLNEWLVPGKDKELIDFVCGQALKSYRQQVGNCVPKVGFGGMLYGDLVESGFAFDKEGQVHLSL